MKLNRRLLMLSLCVVPFVVQAQNDVIMLRDGREKHVKITQVGRRQTFFKYKDDRRADEEAIDNSEIYLLKYETRGNAYFDENGQLLSATTEPVDAPDDACTIYTLDHREIVAWNVVIQEYMVTYDTSRPAKRKKREDEGVKLITSVPKVDVFFIRYPDGTRDVLNEFRDPTPEPPATTAVQPEPASTDQQPAETATSPTGRVYPCRAVITTKKRVKMQVYIYAEDPTTVSYRKTKSETASVFKISRKNIASIKYQ